jgi:hypothetical protein
VQRLLQGKHRADVAPPTAGAIRPPVGVVGQVVLQDAGLALHGADLDVLAYLHHRQPEQRHQGGGESVQPRLVLCLVAGVQQGLPVGVAGEVHLAAGSEGGMPAPEPPPA